MPTLTIDIPQQTLEALAVEPGDLAAWERGAGQGEEPHSLALASKGDS